MTNEFILDVENKLHGIHTRLKELHYSAPSMSVHKLIDEYVDKFLDYDDSLMEGSQAIWGFIQPGQIQPILPEAMDFEELLADIRGILVSIKKEAGDNMLWTGIIDVTDSFFGTTNEYIYLIKICKHEGRV